ncbi:MAG: exodeoxyribonuclease VII small subunit [Anaerolineae bacterium]|nr:exodeoxyribonuclease VII small subunit [Anaerolineae bacterium]
MPKKSQDPSFEDLYNELEATIEKLEAGNLALDDALALYQRGMELAGQCGTLLDRAELKIQELAPNARDLEQDEPDLDFDDDDDE